MRWKIFVVTHGPLFREYLECDPGLKHERFSILDVSELDHSFDKRFEHVRMVQLPHFTALGKHWAESEAIYSLWKSGEAEDLDFIGFTQYDKPLKFAKFKFGRHSVTQEIQKQIDLHAAAESPRMHISLESHSFKRDYKQRILADFEVQDRLTGAGRNAYFKIIEDYNAFTGQNRSIEDLRAQRLINLCSSFVVDQNTFQNMMRFWDFVLGHSNLDALDAKRQWRLQGGLAERYFGAFLALHGPGLIDFTIPHQKPKQGA